MIDWSTIKSFDDSAFKDLTSKIQESEWKAEDKITRYVLNHYGYPVDFEKHSFTNGNKTIYVLNGETLAVIQINVDSYNISLVISSNDKELMKYLEICDD